MYGDRKPLYAELAKQRNSAVLSYVTGDRTNLQTVIAPDAIDLMGDLLDHYEGSKRISLFLYTRGGDVLASWSVVKLLREFCDELEIIIPLKCHSGGTLICLGADQIVMTKQSTLSPIDPSINSPINPQMPGHPEMSRMSLSVEDVAGFIEMAGDEGKLKGQENFAQVFTKLADNVHPVVLGRIKRARDQIQDLARKLLQAHMDDEKKIKEIIKILCTEAGSHDYMIYRKEGRADLGLNIETPSMDLYKLIRAIYQDIRKELELDKPFNPAIGLVADQPKPYELTRALIESQSDGAYHFKKKGTYTKIQQAGQAQIPGKVVIQEELEFDGWEFVA